jgi:hypothetical protein
MKFFAKMPCFVSASGNASRTVLIISNNHYIAVKILDDAEIAAIPDCVSPDRGFQALEERHRPFTLSNHAYYTIR